MAMHLRIDILIVHSVRHLSRPFVRSWRLRFEHHALVATEHWRTKIGVFLCCSQTADGATTTPSAPPTPHATDTLCRDFQLCALQVPRKYIS
jgi:hypothetical protein